MEARDQQPLLMFFGSARAGDLQRPSFTVEAVTLGGDRGVLKDPSCGTAWLFAPQQAGQFAEFFLEPSHSSRHSWSCRIETAVSLPEPPFVLVNSRQIAIVDVSLQFRSIDTHELAMGEIQRHGVYLELIQVQDPSAVLCLRTIHETLGSGQILFPRYVSDEDLKDLPTMEIMDSDNHQIGRMWTNDRVHHFSMKTC